MSQIETIMLVALGFVAALLVGLLLFRVVWSYALSLGKRRVEKRAPSAIAELKADRDRLKAEYAMQGRRLQLRLDDIKTRMTEQMAEASRNRNRIEQLAGEIRSRDELIAKKDSEITNLKSQTDALERELADRTELVQQTKDLLLMREEETIEIRGKLVEVENRLSDQSLLSRAFDIKSGAPSDVSNSEAIEMTGFESAHERLRIRIEELNALTKHIDEQRRDLSVQQEELATLQNQIKRSSLSDKKATAALKAIAENADDEIGNEVIEADEALSGINDATEQLERQIFVAETETKSLTEELLRLDEMWQANSEEFNLTDDKPKRASNLSLVSSNTQRKKPDQKQNSKVKSASKKSAGNSKTRKTEKPAQKSTPKAKTNKTSNAGAKGKTRQRKASKPDVMLPDSTGMVKASNELASSIVEADNSTLQVTELNEKSNVISLAQRIRLLQTDLSRKP
ncbi:MAG: hypothetical protein WBD37_02890 [Anderseniella sp.]